MWCNTTPPKYQSSKVVQSLVIHTTTYGSLWFSQNFNPWLKCQCQMASEILVTIGSGNHWFIYWLKTFILNHWWYTHHAGCLKKFLFSNHNFEIIWFFGRFRHFCSPERLRIIIHRLYLRRNDQYFKQNIWPWTVTFIQVSYQCRKVKKKYFFYFSFSERRSRCSWLLETLYTWYHDGSAGLALSHYLLNQCGIIIGWTNGNKFQLNFNLNTTFSQGNSFDNVIYKMAFC